MKVRILSRFPTLTALIAGGLLPLAYAPHHYFWLAILSPALLLYLWQSSSPKKAFLLGFAFGLGMWGVGVSWVFVSIHDFGNTSVPLALFITSLLVLLYAFITATQGYCLKRFFKGNRTLLWLIGFPSLWVLFEWFRAWFLTGFPWLFLGYTQLDTPLGGLAPLLSVYGVSLAVAITAGAIVALSLGNKKIKLISLGIVVVLWAGGEYSRRINWTTPRDKLFSVSMVQANISPFDKFTHSNPILAAEQNYDKPSSKQWGKDLILWPESAILYPLPDVKPYLDKLNDLAKVKGTTLITGILTALDEKDYYNSMIALGAGNGVYHKRHLLPFGDFLPFETYLRGLISFFNIPLSSFIPGPDKQPDMHIDGLSVAPLICYEIAFPELVRESVQNKDVIVTLSEDGWFGKSWGPYQHLQIAEMRALETGRYVLRSTTSGLTAIIDPKGKVEKMAPPFTTAVLEGSFYKMTGDTPWMKLGGSLPLMLVLLACFLLPGRLTIQKK